MQEGEYGKKPCDRETPECQDGESDESIDDWVVEDVAMFVGKLINPFRPSEIDREVYVRQKRKNDAEAQQLPAERKASQICGNDRSEDSDADIEWHDEDIMIWYHFFMNLKERLKKEKKTRWLDVGCGGNFEDGFYYLDVFPEGMIDARFRKKYFRVDLLSVPTAKLNELGTFDVIRLQHTFEHFSYEEGLRVLKICADLLKKDGIILISTPDLRVHVEKYKQGEYQAWKGFKWWANQRIPEDAPDSFYFSIFAQSMPYESHKWCYDAEGLIFQLKTSGRFKNIKELKLTDPLSQIPFTHNRPEEDVCVIAEKK
jgi:predicted SAM-dependent methyltransferase